MLMDWMAAFRGIEKRIEARKEAKLGGMFGGLFRRRR